MWVVLLVLFETVVKANEDGSATENKNVEHWEEWHRSVIGEVK